ncbi:glycosyltransferase family 4 protein [Dongia deserti]|uniref:glycosyltransferase family 4 protein n=1 Tax=Dongia deserti TaxID=2268030 RepID=UPI000E65937B|nr:glycosyltransferase family 4 protein [Dongia deserti]
MRLAWIVSEADPAVASFRYRCLIPAWALHQIGHDSAIFIDQYPDPAAFDALIIVKQAGERLHEVARAFRSHGRAVFLDLCDNVFIPGYAQRRDPNLSAESTADLARYADAIVTPSQALERVVRRHLGDLMASRVVPDGAITPDAYQAMCAWLPRSLAAAARSGPSGARDLHDGGMFDVESDWQVEHLPEDTARVLWFGRHGSFHSEFGMALLRPVIEELEHVHRDRPIELVVISNNRVRFDALTHGVKIFTRYEAWSNERVFFELSRADLFVMPSGTDAFSVCKSANRAVLSLANNVPVVATYLEALEPLRDVIMLDDWRAGLDAYLFSRHTAKEHLRRAQPILAEQFSVEAIGRQWQTIVGRGRAELSESNSHWQPAAQMA